MSKIPLGDLTKAIGDQLGPLVDQAVSKALGETNKSGKEPPMESALGASLIRERKFTLKDEQKGIPAARFVRALAFGKGDVTKAAFFAKKTWNDDLGDEVQKALVSTEQTAGGALVIPEYAAEIIELLRSKTVVRAAGARSIPMPSGSLTIRRQTGAGTASYVGEDQDIGVTEPTTGQIAMTAKKLAAIVPISNDLLKFTSSPSADEFVRDDLVMTIAIREDRAFIRDDGTAHTPRGMRYWASAANITATNGTSATNIEEDFRDLIDGLENADVRLTRPAFFMHPSRKNYLRNLRDANGNLIFPEMRNANPVMYGHPVFVTTSIPRNLGGGTDSELYFADMAECLIGEVSELEIVADSSASYLENSSLVSAFSRDETAIRAITRHDFGVRHPEAIAVKTAIAWGA